MSGRLPGPRDPLNVARIGTAMLRDPYGTLPRLRDRYGPLCAVGYGPTRFVYMLGRDENEFVLSTGAANFRWREVFLPVLGLVDGDTALVVTDGEEHRRRRRLVQPAFHLHRVNGHLDVMLDELNATIDAWPPGGTLDAYAELRATVRRIVSRALFGSRLGDAADALGAHLQPALDFINRPMRAQLHAGPAWRRMRRGRAAADRLLHDEIARRRARQSNGPASDVLDELLDARDEHGGQLTDDEVADQIRSLIAAGYDTTSGTLGWAVWALLAHPDETAKLRAELDAVVGGRPLRAEDVSELKALDRFVSEVLRLWGAAVVGARYAATSFEYLGHEVPAGSRVLYSPYVTQRLPELWPDPLAFTPDRWLDDDVAPPYSYVPFGGGPRRCIGFAFALLEIKAALVTVLARTELSLARGHRMRPTGVAAMYPRGGVPVQVGRIVGARV